MRIPEFLRGLMVLMILLALGSIPAISAALGSVWALVVVWGITWFALSVRWAVSLGKDTEA